MPGEKDDLRSALEKAYNEVESAGSEPAAPPEARGPAENTAEPVRTAAPTERSEPVEGAGDTAPTDQPESSGERVRGPDGKFLPKEGEAQPQQQEVKPEQKEQDRSFEGLRTEKAPESWRPMSREQWGKIPPEARQEIIKREREMDVYVQRTAAQRKIADAFMQTVNPFMGMIQAEGGNPIQTVQNLLQTAAFLRTGPSAQKAVMVAKLVKDFGINIEDLDRALVGEQIPEKPEDKLNQLLEQRLAPVNEFIRTVQGARQQRSQQVDTEVDQEINNFANDPKNEFFKYVYNDMADMIEIAARRGQTLSMQAAYDRACQMNDEVQKVLQARAAQKRQASTSLPLRGAPPSPPAQGEDLRSTIERAFDSVASG